MKKEYLKPETEVLILDSMETILAGSPPKQDTDPIGGKPADESREFFEGNDF